MKLTKEQIEAVLRAFGFRTESVIKETVEEIYNKLNTEVE